MTGLGAADATALDAIRLEVVAHRRLRSLVIEHRATLTQFEYPLGKAGLI